MTHCQHLPTRPLASFELPRLVAVLAICATLGACGGSSSEPDDQPRDASTTTSIEPESPAPSTPEGTAPQNQPTAPAVGDVPDRSAPAASQETTRLTGVDVQGAPNGGTVTFTFNGALPGYNIGYTTLPPRQDGSGNAVALRGDSGLAIRFNPASDVDLTGGLNRTYTGPERINGPSGSNLAEIAKVSSYEQQLVWAIGVNRKANFDVTTQQNPSRIVVHLRP